VRQRGIVRGERLVVAGGGVRDELHGGEVAGLCRVGHPSHPCAALDMSMPSAVFTGSWLTPKPSRNPPSVASAMSAAPLAQT
jgi:hypothetical protein